MILLFLLAVLAQPAPALAPDSLRRADPTPRPSNETATVEPRTSDTGLLAHSTTGPRSEPDRWLAMDKFWHFSASFVTVGAAYHLAENRVRLSAPWPAGLALGGTFTIGICKEFNDLAGPTRHFSWKDLVADAAGICAGYFAFVHRY